MLRSREVLLALIGRNISRDSLPSSDLLNDIIWYGAAAKPMQPTQTMAVDINLMERKLTEMD